MVCYDGPLKRLSRSLSTELFALYAFLYFSFLFPNFITKLNQYLSMQLGEGLRVSGEGLRVSGEGLRA